MSIHPNVLQNGQVRAAAEAMLSPGQVGLLAGWGVFSTLRVQAGVLFEYDRHWARMAHDAARMHVPMPRDAGQLRDELLQLVAANQAWDSTLRVVVVRNGGGMWEGPAPTGSACDVMALTAGLKPWGSGVSLMSQPHARHAACEFAGAKILSWAHNLTWVERAQKAGFDELVLWNERGEVAECTSANLFIVNGSEVWTPPLACGCLPGVTRAVLLEAIREPGIRIGERVLQPADLLAADEVFITSTTRDLLAVERIDDQVLTPRGDVRARLSRQFTAYRDAYVARHAASAPVTGRS